MTAEEFRKIASSIPANPGIYKYFDASDSLLYVGKAKNLRKRVSSYFVKRQANYKTHELVNRIHRIEFTIVNSEQDALLLENSLIKNFQPRFNIDLKDDKTYPFIVIKNEAFPRVFLTRTKTDDGSEYLGPYTSVQKVRELLLLIKQNIQLRTCSLDLKEANIKKGKFKVCLEYHLGNCKGPCEGLQSPEDYETGIVQLRNLLRGNLQPVIQHFKSDMKELAAQMAFEKADLIRKKIEYLENYQARSTIVNPRLSDIDVFSVLKEGPVAYVNYLMVQNGSIVQTKTIRLETHLDEPVEEILPVAMLHLRTKLESRAKEIIAPFPITWEEPELTITVPRAGDKKKLLDLSLKNAAYFIEEIKKKQRLQLTQPGASMEPVLLQLQEDLKLTDFPAHIECFDNSHFQGAYTVSAMVCFKDGIPSKKDYRHFNIKTVKGIDDFASMKEAVYRRYKRVLNEGLPFPQLIIIDGGKGQLSAAIEAMDELGLMGSSTLVGLAKNEEELFFAGDQESLKLPYDSASLKLVRRIRDEVHRFGIGFHRDQRSRGTFKNELEGIKGIGKATADQLLKQFRSVKNVKEQSLEKLTELVGAKKASLIRKHFEEGRK
ncbi:MAG: excinuclease ABC subunit C [Chitinophagales bacterium]|nr:excinuclease ABC subunit C [Chitinophagales bacterium]